MTGRVGKTRNIWLTWLIWPLITLGIYHFVWYYKINREARDFDENIDVKPELSLLAVLIGWIIIVPPFVSIYRTGERIAQMQEDAGMERSCSGVIGLVLAFFAGLYSLYYQYELNRIWARLGNPQEGSLVALPVGGAVPASAPNGVPADAPNGVPDRAADGSATGTAAEEPQAARSGGAPGLRPDEPKNTGPENGSSAGT
ncbi:MAG TPA: DUF4234 domain-containing protein [Streptosporangiaceae bacterium]|nr:DUF4234 domain-containing protein [Streptosporangiaceae bacterium]